MRAGDALSRMRGDRTVTSATQGTLTSTEGAMSTTTSTTDLSMKAGTTTTTADTKAKTVAYWATTALVALAFVAGGAADLARPPEMMATMAHLGYPAYVATILGLWKLAGAAAVLAP